MRSGRPLSREYQPTTGGDRVPFSRAGRPRLRGDDALVRHIVDGDNRGGGHRSGAGRWGKTEFPPGWDAAAIVAAIEQVLIEPRHIVSSLATGDDYLRFVGTVNEVRILVRIRADDHAIDTAYPLDGFGVVQHTRRGRVARPLGTVRPGGIELKP